MSIRCLFKSVRPACNNLPRLCENISSRKQVRVMEPPFYIVKMGFKGVYIIFLDLLQRAKMKKYYNFYLKIILFIALRCYSVLSGRVFVMWRIEPVPVFVDGVFS